MIHQPNKSDPTPVLDCLPLRAPPPADLESAIKTFAGLAKCPLGQHWLPQPEPGFEPAEVSVGWHGSSLYILAELADADIHTRATADQQKMWELGDVFEIFLRPESQESYREFHVTPNNKHLQLRFANSETVTKIHKTGSMDEMLIPGRAFSSTTWVQPEKRRWWVLAEIPAASVDESCSALPGARWMFSFCRYDYTRGRSQPVLSSTSPHSVPKFHQLRDWGLIRFQP